VNEDYVENGGDNEACGEGDDVFVGFYGHGVL
jgi:hypothetical protein